MSTYVESDNATLHDSANLMLSGGALLQAHISPGKSLPKDGAKDFSPTNSWMEKKQIQSALDERKDLLDSKRVEKWGTLAGAVWDHKKKLAEVTRRTGKHFQTLGFEKDGTLYLYPEEALFLLETNCLELLFGGVPVSVQQGYSLLLGSASGCNLIEYRTYSHLMRQGYKLLRFTHQISYTRYERAIRLDQHALKKRSHSGQGCHKKKNVTAPRDIKPEIMTENDNSHAATSIDSFTTSKINVKEESANCSSICLNNLSTPLETSGDSSTSCKDGSVEINTNDQVEDIDEDSSSRQNISPDFQQTNLENFPKECRRNSVTYNAGIIKEIDQQSMSVCPERLDSTLEDTSEHLEVNSTEKDSPLSQQPQEDNESCENLSPSVEGIKKKAYGIAESLLSLQNVLSKKAPDARDDTHISEKGTPQLSDTLQSKILEVLGAHLQSGVSEEDLAIVASKAANTILSHISTSGELTETRSKDIDQANNSEQETDENMSSDSAVMNAESSENYESVILKESEEKSSIPPSSSSGTCSREKTSCEMVEDIDDSTKMEVVHEVFASPQDEVCESEVEEQWHQVKRPASPNRGRDESEPASKSKKAKVSNMCDSDVEILDFVPEEKRVELVDLSDESSLDGHYEGKDQHDDDSIEVIDVNDSSCSESSESGSSSNSSDSPVFLEEKKKPDWENERRQILESFPDMHNLSEIALEPPSLDLLPENVRPQHSRYILSRGKLIEESRERWFQPPHYPQDQLLPRLGPVFNHAMEESPHQTIWQPNAHINPMSAVQAVAQLILPMLGIPTDSFTSDQMWIPSNPWFQPRSSWGNNTGPRFQQHSFRGNYRPRFRSRPYRSRPFPHRFNSGRRGPPNLNFLRGAQNHSQPRHYPSRTEGHVSNMPRSLEESSTPNNHGEFNSSNDQNSEGSNRWRAWMPKSRSNQRVRKRSQRGRYFFPPQSYKHMKSVLEENSDIISVKSDESSLTHETSGSPNVKSESFLNDDSSNERLNVVKSENSDTDSSSEESETSVDNIDSPSELKSLLSPSDCTSFESVFKALKVIKDANPPDLVLNAHRILLKPQFDLFSPGKPFRKGNPPTPDYHLCIMRPDENIPSPGERRALMDILGDSVPIMFAIVSPDSIGFMQFCDVSLPSFQGSN